MRKDADHQGPAPRRQSSVMRAPLWQEIKTVFRAEGIAGIWTRFLSRTIYRRLILVQRMLDQPDPSVETDVSLSISLLQPDEAGEYCLLRKDAEPEGVINRLQSNNLCFAARYENRLVAVCWAATRAAPIDYLEMRLPLSTGDVYVFDSFTAPDYRGRNVAGARGLYMIRYFREAGYKRLIGSVLPENKPALRPLEKLGYRPYAIAGRWKLGPLRREFVRNMP